MNKDKKPCPHCAEMIQAAANKCRYCNEWLDGRTSSVPQAQAPAAPIAPAPASWSKRVAWIAVVGVGLALYRGGRWVKNRDAAAQHIGEYTNRIAQIIKAECPRYTMVQSYDLAASFRDEQLKGNARYCSENVSVPMPQGQVDSCLGGPPKGYPPLARVRPIVQAMAESTCR